MDSEPRQRQLKLTHELPSETKTPFQGDSAAESSFARTANWAVGLAAAALVFISVGGYFYHREKLAAIAAEHLRLVVAGPSILQAGVAAEYTVDASTISGRALPAQIEVALLAPDGRRLKSYKETTDDRGRVQVAVPADLRLPAETHLRVAASHGDSREEAETALVVRGAGQALPEPKPKPPIRRDRTPKPKGEGDVVLNTGPGVFEVGAPLEFNLRATKPGRPLVVAAYWRGVQIGQQMIVTKAAANPAAIALDNAIGGPIRLIVYDYSATPPNPLAERLVYRRPSQPNKADDLKNADLDLLLGTEGQRLCAEQSPRSAFPPPFVYDNIGQIHANYEKCLADYQADRTWALNTLTAASFFGGLGLVLLVAMLGLMRIVSGMHLWIPAVGATTCCLIVGAILMDPGRLATDQGVAVGFSPYHAPAPATQMQQLKSP